MTLPVNPNLQTPQVDPPAEPPATPPPAPPPPAPAKPPVDPSAQDSDDTGTGQFKDMDHAVKSYAGLQTKYNIHTQTTIPKLTDERDQALGRESEVKGQLAQVGTELDDLKTTHAELVANSGAAGQELTKAQAELERKNLLLHEFPDLGQLDQAGLLPPLAEPTIENFKEQFIKARETLEEMKIKTQSASNAGATPPPPATPPGQDSHSLDDLHKLHDKLSREGKYAEASKVLEQIIALP